MERGLDHGAVQRLLDDAVERLEANEQALRDGLRSVQLAFREASAMPDAPGFGPGEKWTGPVN